MLTAQGPYVLEYNCRLGDPETQALLPLLDTDLLEIIVACVNGSLAELPVQWKSGACASVVLAAENYPQAGTPSRPISGLDAAPRKTVSSCIAAPRMPGGRFSPWEVASWP